MLGRCSARRRDTDAVHTPQGNSQWFVLPCFILMIPAIMSVVRLFFPSLLFPSPYSPSFSRSSFALPSLTSTRTSKRLAHPFPSSSFRPFPLPYATLIHPHRSLPHTDFLLIASILSRLDCFLPPVDTCFALSRPRRFAPVPPDRPLPRRSPLPQPIHRFPSPAPVRSLPRTPTVQKIPSLFPLSFVVVEGRSAPSLARPAPPPTHRSCQRLLDDSRKRWKEREKTKAPLELLHFKIEEGGKMEVLPLARSTHNVVSSSLPRLRRTRRRCA